MVMLALIDVADPRYGGAPDPDEERRRRWERMDRHVSVPVLGAFSCLIAAGVISPEMNNVFNLGAVGLCWYAVRAALPRRRRPAPDQENSAGDDAGDERRD